MQNPVTLQIRELDEVSRAIYLYVPREQIVLIQGIIESYEILGVVRTLDLESGLIAIITSKDFIAECLDLLNSLRQQIRWRIAPQPSEDQNPAGL